MWEIERVPPARDGTGHYVETPLSPASPAVLARIALGAAMAVAFWVCIRLSEVDPAALIAGIPRLLNWAAKAWPPYLADLDVYWLRAAETVAIATVATVTATILAFPLSIFIAHNTSPSPWLAAPVRLLVNSFRGVDTIVFALLFVAAVGLGPFAGVLGMIVHSLGVIAKLNSEAIETVPKAPLEAAAMTGANRTKIVSYALLPSVLPNLTSVSLYVWEANVRTSTILGIVGAGGIGIEIKAAIDLLDFPKLLTVTVIMLIMVTLIDQFSAWLRRRLV
ncbi:phosphonate ABC transporter, permease protein PhnE [Xanthobacter pseudotagetidis]|uniref:phosphonate ABC transporter, permease protein PhnE n=1 Tax=Xanthobacter pseudotagetidis TaxID=3119911 RepID=UPI00372C979A